VDTSPEISKRRVITPIFESAAEIPASGEDCTYKPGVVS